MKIIKDNRTATVILNSLKTTKREGVNNKALESLINYSNIDSLFNSYNTLGQNNNLINYTTNSLSFVDPKNIVDKNRLEALYDQRKDIIKDEIIDNQNENEIQGICWYCHLPNIDTLDHFLPKSEFPELSIYPNNLLLCCNSCNSIKNSIYKGPISDSDNTNILYYVNPYYTDIDTITFLKCEITINGKKINYEYSLDDTKLNTISFGNEIKKQYSQLHLCKKYKKLSNTLITELTKSFIANPDSNLNNFCDYVKRQCKIERISFGPNYWKCACYDAICNNMQFLQILINKIQEKIQKLKL